MHEWREEEEKSKRYIEISYAFPKLKIRGDFILKFAIRLILSCFIFIPKWMVLHPIMIELVLRLLHYGQVALSCYCMSYKWHSRVLILIYVRQVAHKSTNLNACRTSGPKEY